MKKLLFLVLILAICAAAFFAKPQDPKASLAAYLGAHSDRIDTLIPAGYVQAKNDWVAGRFEFKDRGLWVDAVAHDHTVYTCVFNHWISRAGLKEAIHEDVKKLKDDADGVKRSIHNATADKPA